MKDLLPPEVELRDRASATILATYARYGFRRVETPALENLRLLLGSGGGENEKLIYKVLKRGAKLDAATTQREDDLADLGLRFDLTVPLARYYAHNRATLPDPFKAIQIGPVWRAERPQKGRFRQFTQCDIDILGVASEIAEIELILATSAALVDARARAATNPGERSARPGRDRHALRRRRRPPRRVLRHAGQARQDRARGCGARAARGRSRRARHRQAVRPRSGRPRTARPTRGSSGSRGSSPRPREAVESLRVIVAGRHAGGRLIACRWSSTRAWYGVWATTPARSSRRCTAGERRRSPAAADTTGWSGGCSATTSRRAASRSGSSAWSRSSRSDVEAPDRSASGSRSSSIATIR